MHVGERGFRALWFNTGEKEARLTISEGSTILRGLAEPCLIDQRRQTGLKLMLCGKASATPFCNICHMTLDPRPSLVFFLQVKKAERGLGTRLPQSYIHVHVLGYCSMFYLMYVTSMPTGIVKIYMHLYTLTLLSMSDLASWVISNLQISS